MLPIKEPGPDKVPPRVTSSPRARGEGEKGLAKSVCWFPKIHGRILRRVNFLPQNCANQRNVLPTRVHQVHSRKQAAQDGEKLRKGR